MTADQRFDWTAEAKRQREAREAVTYVPVDDNVDPVADVPDEVLRRAFDTALARLSLIAQGATVKLAPRVTSPGHESAAPTGEGPGPWPGSEVTICGVRLRPDDQFKRMSTADRVIALRRAWPAADRPDARRDLVRRAHAVLALERRGLPKLRHYDRTEAMRREIADLPGTYREVADQFDNVSHESVRQWRKHFRPTPAVPTLKERTRLAATDDSGRALA